MTSSSANVPAADSSSTNEHRFPWKWNLADLEKVEKNGKTVFSCFSCGGGSSMGYKLAGYDVIGCCEIDPRVMAVYKANNHPKYPYLMDVRQFVDIPNEELPPKLFNLDILDGSPPCSVFSTAGVRGKGWNKEKVFREGQAKQKLDDLFFWFIKIADKLKPRAVIAENVSGLIKGNAKGYVNEIFKAFDAAGYKTQLFLLNAAFMGVPQRRERCFFVAYRKDQPFTKITLDFKETPILYEEVKAGEGQPIKEPEIKRLVQYVNVGEKQLSKVRKRLNEKETGYSRCVLWEHQTPMTIVSGNYYIRGSEKLMASDNDLVNISTFPQDYDFGNQSALYICGMSVPPVMMAQVATEVYNQWLRT